VPQSNRLSISLAAEVISAELEPLGMFLDRYESKLLKPTPQERAHKFLTVAKRARHLIEQGLDMPGVRKGCLGSPALLALLEAALFDRAGSAGKLSLACDLSQFGR
jgi:hypothetical protein